MPYEIKKENDKFCVVKKDDGSVIKCHDTMADAEAHMKALYANVPEAKSLWITREQMKEICPSCAKKMSDRNIKRVNLYELPNALEVKTGFSQGLCDKVGGDPGFFTKCKDLDIPDVKDKDGFCAELHNYCLGEYPAESKSIKATGLSLDEMMADMPDDMKAKMRECMKAKMESGMSQEEALTSCKESMNQTKSFDFKNAVIAFGDSVKTIGDKQGTKHPVGGYLVRFSNQNDLDTDGDFFDAQTDYGMEFPGKTKTWFHHTLPVKTSKGLKSINYQFPIGELSQDDIGIFFKSVLNEANEYEKIIWKLVEMGKIRLSSGVPDHLTRRTKTVNGANHIDRWLLGLDASYDHAASDYNNIVKPIDSLKTIDLSALLSEAEGQAMSADDLRSIKTLLEGNAMTEEEKKIAEAQAKAIIDQGKQLEEQKKVIEEQAKSVKTLTDQINLLTTVLKKEKPLSALGVQVASNDDRPYKSLGEQLVDVARAANPDTRIDAIGRLSNVKTFNDKFLEAKGMKATGMSEGVMADGGFLVQVDISTAIFEKAWQTGKLVTLCARQPIGANFNGVKIPAVDETSRADGSRWGGVRGYWGAEGGTLTKSKPTFRWIELNLKKLHALVYATDELLADAVALEGFVMRVVPLEIGFKVDDAIINGLGGGVPLGLLAAPCLVTVAKETGQAANTILTTNISKMWARLPAESQGSVVWLANVDTQPQLDELAIPVGTAGLEPRFVTYDQQGATRIKGRQVIFCEQCATLGTVGDFILADFQQYLLSDKGGIQAASSMHVQFLTDEMTYRWTYRLDGQPAYASAITPFKGTNTLSPFIVLATRA